MKPFSYCELFFYAAVCSFSCLLIPLHSNLLGIVLFSFALDLLYTMIISAGGMNGSIVFELDRPENAGLKKSLKVFLSRFLFYKHQHVTCSLVYECIFEV